MQLHKGFEMWLTIVRSLLYSVVENMHGSDTSFCKLDWL